MGGGDPADPTKKKPPFQFAPPNYNQFALDTGFGYGSLFDQMRDAFSMPSRGAGQFNGNKLARYATPAPQVTIDPMYNLLNQFASMQKQQGMGMQGTGRNGLGGLLGGGLQPTQMGPGGRGGRGLL